MQWWHLPGRSGHLATLGDIWCQNREAVWWDRDAMEGGKGKTNCLKYRKYLKNMILFNNMVYIERIWCYSTIWFLRYIYYIHTHIYVYIYIYIIKYKIIYKIIYIITYIHVFCTYNTSNIYSFDKYQLVRLWFWWFCLILVITWSTEQFTAIVSVRATGSCQSDTWCQWKIMSVDVFVLFCHLDIICRRICLET